MSNRQPEVKKPFQHATLGEANDNCSANLRNGRRDSGKGAKCEVCTMKVILHCYDCMIQITGCLCTEYERFGNDEAWARAVARWGEEAARQRAEAAGLWVPPTR